MNAKNAIEYTNQQPIPVEGDQDPDADCCTPPPHDPPDKI
jgi:hypothetical protein